MSHVKKKLDQLKARLPDLEESPVPSPSKNTAPPTGSESAFQGMEEEDDSCSLVVGGHKMVSVEPVMDNQDVEDTELSDVEGDTSKIIGMFCRSSRIIQNLGIIEYTRSTTCFGLFFSLLLEMLVKSL